MSWLEHNKDMVESLRGYAGIDPQDPEIMIDGFGGLGLKNAILKIQQDAAKLDPNDIKKSDILFIRNASIAIAELTNDSL